MTKLANRWAGRIFGTNTGNLFIELNQDGSMVNGVIRILDNVFGISVYTFNGTYSDKLILNCSPKNTKEGVEYGDVNVEAYLTPDGNLRGEWCSTIGTAGTFNAFPHDLNQKSQDISKSDLIPEQIFNKNVPIGSLRLYREDLLALIEYARKDFLQGRVVITFDVRGSQLTKYADDFLKDLDGVEELNYIKLTIQEPEAYGINKVIVIELNQVGTSEIRISGINESWVLGKAESMHQILKRHTNFLVTTYRKHGLNLNAAIFVAMLIAIPEMNNWQQRTVFVAIVLLLLKILLFTHSKFIPNTAIYLTDKKPGIFVRAWPSILSWLIASTSALAASYAFYLLNG